MYVCVCSFVMMMMMMMMTVKTSSTPSSHTHLPCLVIVLDLTQIPPAGLSDPLPRDQVPDHHGRGADLWGVSHMTAEGWISKSILRPRQSQHSSI